MRLALATERPVVGNVEANLKTLEKRVKAAKADVVLFGELFLSGYMARDKFVNLAMPMDGDVVGRVRDAAKGAGKAIIAGFPRRDDKMRGVVYDSALFVDKRGKTDYYDKWFLANFGPFEEKLFFGQGRRLPIWDVDGFKFGTQICYDLFFPEIAKALLGADCLVNISASPNISRKNFELLFPARAVENGYFVAYCNVAGTQEDLVFWGGSQVWGPRGDQKILAPYTNPSFVTVEIDPAEIDAARPLRPTLRDTRDDMVTALANALRGLDA
jgi:5-aminopentanamidase